MYEAANLESALYSIIHVRDLTWRAAESTQPRFIGQTTSETPISLINLPYLLSTKVTIRQSESGVT